jgi:hypothetical protein
MFSDPVPDIVPLSREELFALRRPRKEVPIDEEQIEKRQQRIALRSEETQIDDQHITRSLKRLREDMSNTSLKVAKISNEQIFDMGDIDFAVIGVNSKIVAKKMLITSEVLVSTVYVNHRLYKLKSELFNIIGILAGFELHWDAISLNQSTPLGRKKSIESLIRCVQNAKDAKDLMEVILTLEMVLPISSLTRGAHRDVIETILCNTLGSTCRPGITLNVHNIDPLPNIGVTAASVAARLFSLDRCIRYEKLPMNFTSCVTLSPLICRTRIEHSPRCIFTLTCNKSLAHFGRCIPTTDFSSRLPDIRPQLDRMIVGEIPYIPDSTILYSNNNSSLTRHNGKQNSSRQPAPDIYSKSPNQNLPTILNTSYDGVGFNICNVQPFVPRTEDVRSTEWV